MRASVEFGGSDWLQFSQVGRSSSIGQRHDVTAFLARAKGDRSITVACGVLPCSLSLRGATIARLPAISGFASLTVGAPSTVPHPALNQETVTYLTNIVIGVILSALATNFWRQRRLAVLAAWVVAAWVL